ncbi:MAG: PilT/PilU family type 4a pilus ATPase [bacterium]
MPSYMNRNLQCAEILKKRGLLSDDIYDTLLKRSEKMQEWIGQVAVNDRIISGAELANALASELRLQLVDLAGEQPEEVALVTVHKDVCQKNSLLPLKINGDTLVIACANPTDIELLEALAEITCYKVIAVVVSLNGIQEKIEKCYDGISHDLLAEAQQNVCYSHSLLNIHQPDDSTYSILLDEMLGEVVKREGSDLHLVAASQPFMRLNGKLERMHYPVLKPQHIKDLIYSVINEEQLSEFRQHHELDFAYTVPGLSRFRVNVYRQNNTVCSVFRVIPNIIPTLAKLKMPEVVRELTTRPRGLVLVTGPTGSGKSTTLAAMIDEINSTRQVHISTLEDPIEFLHIHKTAEVTQREIGTDTESFASGLMRMLRQDPDVIFIGEMRDQNTIAAAVTAAETGHLVFATLHTNSAAQSIDRIIDIFPPHQQGQVRNQLAIFLEGIITQTLLPNIDGKGRSCAQEILIATPAVRNLIRENKVHQIASVMQAGSQYGMQTLDQALVSLVKSKKVSLEEALLKASSADNFRSLMSMQS